MRTDSKLGGSIGHSLEIGALSIHPNLGIPTTDLFRTLKAMRVKAYENLSHRTLKIMIRSELRETVSGETIRRNERVADRQLWTHARGSGLYTNIFFSVRYYSFSKLKLCIWIDWPSNIFTRDDCVAYCLSPVRNSQALRRAP